MIMKKEMIGLEIRNREILPSRWLDNFTDEQKMRMALLLEEMVEAEAGCEGIRYAIKHERDKEIIFAVLTPECQYLTPQLQLK